MTMTTIRITRSLAGVAVILFLAVACLLLVRELRSASNLQDCLMSGRTNCAPIEPSDEDRQDASAPAVPARRPDPGGGRAAGGLRSRPRLQAAGDHRADAMARDERSGMAGGRLVARLRLGGARRADGAGAGGELRSGGGGGGGAPGRRAGAHHRRLLLPTVGVTGSAGRVRESLGAQSFSFNDFLIEPSVSYEIDFWDKNHAALEGAKASALASRYAKQVVALTVETSVANTYFQILALQEEIRVAEDNLATARDALKGVAAQQSAGAATQLDVTQQQTVVAQQRAAIPPLQQQLVHLTAPAILLGEPQERDKMPRARSPRSTVAEGDAACPQSCWRGARMSARPNSSSPPRPHQGGARRFLPQHHADRGRRLRERRARLAAAGELAHLRRCGGLHPADLRRRRARRSAAAVEAQYEQLVADYRKTVISAFSDVENALIATRKTAEQLEDQEDTVAKARLAYQISEAQYQGGTVTLLTVLTTENALFPAETTLVQDRLAYLQAVVGLFQALGGGWTGEASAIDPPKDAKAGNGL